MIKNNNAMIQQTTIKIILILGLILLGLVIFFTKLADFRSVLLD